MPKGLERLSDFPNLTAAMQRRGWTPSRIRKVLGGNWLRLFREVWRA
jgi:membrane dipeptidase